MTCDTYTQNRPTRTHLHVLSGAHLPASTCACQRLRTETFYKSLPLACWASKKVKVCRDSPREKDILNAKLAVKLFNYQLYPSSNFVMPNVALNISINV